MSADQLSSSRLRRKLDEQLGYLRRSAAEYDQGHESEALRLATALRVLLHNTAKSHSLLAQIGILNTQFLSSSRGHGDWKDFLRIAINLHRAPPVAAQPILGDAFFSLPFAQWWSGESVFVHNGAHYTRSRVILSAANKDGGAHVDPKLEAYYDHLCQGEYLLGITGNFTFNGPAPWPQGVTIYPSNGHLALLRQFAHEVLATAKHYKWPVASP